MSEKERQKITGVRVFKDEQGATLLVFLFILSALAALAFGTLKLTSLNLETSLAHNKNKKAFYSSELGLELAVNTIIRSFEALIPYTDSASNGGDANGFLTVSNYNGYEVKYKITQDQDRFLYQTVKGQDILTHYAYTYDIETISTSLAGDSTETLRERIRILETPLVQWFIFFGGGPGPSADLEIHSGSTWTSWGRIHTNGSLHVGSTQGATHRFQNFDPNGGSPIETPHVITVVGDIERCKKFGFGCATQNAEVKTTNTSTIWEDGRAIDQTINAGNEVTQEGLFNDFVLVNEALQNTPQPVVIQRAGFYEVVAGNPQLPGVDGIKIIGQGGLGAGNIEVFASRPAANTDVTALVLAGETSTGNAYSGPMPIIREVLNDFGDCREDDRVDLTDIDLYALTLWFEEYVADPANGSGTLGGGGFIIYASRSPDATFTNAADPLQGIRLKEIGAGSSPQLQANTTFATDNPLYMEGDFNTQNVKGTAIIADAINVLSNDWDNTKACGGGMPDGDIETSANAAFFTGNSPTVAGTYGGGVHNYPRFHEDWNVPFNYRGSFVNLWTSIQATGDWCLGGDCYSAPTRNWGWDTNFGNPSYWPPYIPSVFEVQRVGFLEG